MDKNNDIEINNFENNKELNRPLLQNEDKNEEIPFLQDFIFTLLVVIKENLNVLYTGKTISEVSSIKTFEI